MHRHVVRSGRPRRAGRTAGSVVLAGVLLAVVSPTASAAPAGWAGWTPLTGTSRELQTTMSQQPAGFPVATVRSTSVAGSGVGVQSGASAFLPPQTPPGQVYGASRAEPYLNLRPAGLNAGPASVTTYSFARPTPASGWTFVLGDVDADAVTVSATDADGEPVSVGDLGFRSVFNYCAPGVTPKPACAPPNNDGTDLPNWDADSATLRGNPGALDSAGAAGWFEPRTALSTLTFRYAQRSGSPVYQTWFSSLQFDLAGTVTAPEGQTEGLLVELFDPSGAKVGETRTGADGSYGFPGSAPFDDYAVRLTPPEGLTSDAPLSRPVDLSGADQTAVDFTLRALRPVPVSGTVRTEEGDAAADVTVTLTDGDGLTRDATTSDGGAFTFDEVAAGADYQLTVVPPEGSSVTPAVREVAVPAGSEEPVTGQDFTLSTVAAGYVVDGTVTDAVGRAVPGAEVVLTPPGAGEGLTATTEEDGRYAVPDVPSGTYVATVVPPRGLVAPARRTVTVEDEDLGGVDFVLERVPPAPTPTADPTTAAPAPTTTGPAPSPSAVPVSAGDAGVLAATGGPSGAFGLLGLLAVVTGTGLLTVRRRSSRS